MIPRSRFIAVIIALSFYGCDSDDLDCLRPSTASTTATYDIDAFNSIVLSTVGDLQITDDTTFYIKAEGPQNVVDNLRFGVEETKLVIYSDACFTAEYDLHLEVGLPDLIGVALTGVGDVVSQGTWTSPSFSIVHGGIGTINALISCDSIVSEAFGTGTLTLNGVANKHYIASTSAVQFNGYGLETALTDILSNGQKNSYIKADQALRVVINGIGDVYYRGQPIITSEINGMGQLIDDN